MPAPPELQAEIANTEEQLRPLATGVRDRPRNPGVGQRRDRRPRRSRNCSSASRKPPQPRASLVEIEQQQEQRRNAILQEVSHRFRNPRNRITQAEERIAALEREFQRLTDETSTAQQQTGKLRWAARSVLAWSSKALSQRVNALAEQIHGHAHSNWKKKRTAETEAQASSSIPCAAEYASMMGKRGSLEARHRRAWLRD